ncbi:MAG: DUF6588 family protein [Bacteroidota bacterium]
MKKNLLSIVLAAVLLIGSAVAQEESELSKTMSKLAGGAIQGFLGPAGSAFGNDLNGGWFHKAPKDKFFGIDLEIGVVGVGTFVSDENKTFNISSSFRFDDAQATTIANKLDLSSTPVIFQATIRNEFKTQLKNNDVQVGFSGPTFLNGDGSPVVVSFNPGTVALTDPSNNQKKNYTVGAFGDTIDGVKGIDLPVVPLPMPQVSLGTVLGTMVTVRGLPMEVPIPNFGKGKFFGFGIQHNLGMWLPIPIVDLAVSYYSTGLSLKAKQNGKEQELLKTTASGFGLNVSKQFGFGFLNVTPYAGYGIEKSKTTISYDAPLNTPAGPTTVPFNVEFDGVNKSRVTLGLSIRLLIININADYNLGKQKSASAGLFFAF